MALAPETIAELQRLIQSGSSELTSDQIVSILNRTRDEANQFIAEGGVQSRDIPDSVYTRFDRDDIVPNRRQFITQGCWSGGVARLNSDSMNLSTCQLSEASSRYFWEVWDKEPDTGDTSEAAKIQFYVTYGHATGRGAPPISSTYPTSTEPTKAIYHQYRNILLPPDQDRFSFKDQTTSEDIYVINIARARYKQKFDPGNWQLNLKFVDPENSDNWSVCKLVDESALTDYYNEKLKIGQLGRVFSVVSGSLNLEEEVYTEPAVIDNDTNILSDDKDYGTFYPDAGIIVLNPAALVEHAELVWQEGPDTEPQLITPVTDPDSGLPTQDPEADPDGAIEWVYSTEPDVYRNNIIATEFGGDTAVWDQAATDRGSSIDPETRTVADILTNDYSGDINAAKVDYDDWPYLKNHSKLFDAVDEAGYFVGRSVEEIVSTHYFVRVRNRFYNFSNNPTFSDADGEFTNPDFYSDPKVFVTTVGLYDDDNNCVAVGKLSKPRMKDFGRELLIKMKLDY